MSGISGLRGQRVYGQHGNRHSPRGSDPSATEPWRAVATAASGTAWDSGTDYSAGDVVDHDSLRWEAILPSGPGVGSAVEPGVDSSYVAYWWCQASVFINGSNKTGSGKSPTPAPMSYRLGVGAPNVIDLDGTIIEYAEKLIEIKGDIGGITLDQTVFVLPPEYQQDTDVPYSMHDDVGGYVPCRLLSTGEFVYGRP